MTRKQKQTGTRLVLRQCYADIVMVPGPDDPLFQWVVQAFGSNELLGWGQESSFEAAEKAAYQFLHERMVDAAAASGSGLD